MQAASGQIQCTAGGALNRYSKPKAELQPQIRAVDSPPETYWAPLPRNEEDKQQRHERRIDLNQRICQGDRPAHHKCGEFRRGQCRRLSTRASRVHNDMGLGCYSQPPRTTSECLVTHLQDYWRGAIPG